MKLSFPAALSQYKGLNGPMSYSESINCVADIPFGESKTSRIGLSTFPGTELVMQDDWNVSSTCNHNGTLFVLYLDKASATSKLASISSAYSKTVLHDFGEILASPEMASNGEVICILNRTVSGYFYDDVNGVEEITDPTWLDYMSESDGVESVDFIDGYFVFCNKIKMFTGSLITENSGKNFDATYFVRPFLRENNVKVINIRGELALFGETQTKFYGNVGGSDFPFQEIPGSSFDKGASYSDGVVSFDGSFFFIGRGKNEKRALYTGTSGGSVRKISTDYQDRILDSYEHDGLVPAFPVLSGFSIDGKAYIVLGLNITVGFEPLDVAFVYDVLASGVTGIPWWTEFNPYQGYEVNLAGIIQSYDDILVFDDEGIFKLSNDSYGIESKDSTNPVTFTSQYLHAESDPVIINRLELVMEVGAGNENTNTANVKNPSVELFISDDGAKTFTSVGTQQVGRSGNYTQRLVWPMLGLAPQSRIFKFVADTGVPLRFHRIDMEVEKGFLYG